MNKITYICINTLTEVYKFSESLGATLGARSETFSTFCYITSQILGADVQNLVARNVCTRVSGLGDEMCRQTALSVSVSFVRFAKMLFEHCIRRVLTLL